MSTSGSEKTTRRRRRKRKRKQKWQKRHSSFSARGRELPSMPLLEALRLFYKFKVLPQEEMMPEGLLNMNRITDVEFTCPATIFVAGEFSVGKSSMLKKILQTDYAGCRVGELPTTDAFFILIYGQNHRLVEAASVISDPRFPYQGLKRLGQRAIQRCRLCCVPSELLRHVTIIDSPGILPNRNAKSRENTIYDKLFDYFSSRADMILFLFDALRPLQGEHIDNAMDTIVKYEGKIQMIMNKVDTCSPAQLDKAQGQLWNWMSQLFIKDYQPTLFLASFCEKPMKHAGYFPRLQQDLQSLFAEFKDLVFNLHIKRLNDVVRRVHRVRTVALVAKEVKIHPFYRLGIAQPRGLAKKLKKDIYPQLINSGGVQEANLPPPKMMEKYLLHAFMTNSPLYSAFNLKYVEEFLNKDMARFKQVLPTESTSEENKEPEQTQISWSFIKYLAKQNGWVNEFNQLYPINGKLDKEQISTATHYSDLSPQDKGKIWLLVCPKDDGLIDENQFYLLKYYVLLAASGRKTSQLPIDPPPPADFIETIKNPLLDESERSRRKRSKRKSKKRRKWLFWRRRK